MGLIERAVGGTTVSEPQSGLVKPFDRIDGEAFDLNLALLKSKGVYTPGGSDAQAYELRAIKRRLLRRIGFLQRAGRDPRQLRTAGRHRNIILCTSTRPGEGKSFVAANLAMSLAAEEGMRVCLVDGDAARPRLRTYFGLPEGRGLTDLLSDGALNIASVSRTAPGFPLTFIGEGSRVANPTDLYGSPAAKRFFASLSASLAQGVVIVDAPPMLATTETIALARHADEVVFVVEADSTPQPAIASALDEVLEINPNVSLLLNRCLVPAGGSHYSAYEYYEKRPIDPAEGAAEGKGDRS
jgi:Mrp family chromosome partitioning ATPase